MGTSPSVSCSGPTCIVKGFSRDGRQILGNTLVNFSFSWYLENIFPELFVPPQALHQGSLRSAVSSLCLTIPRGRKKDLISQAVSVQSCKHFPNPKWNIQTWHFSSRLTLSHQSSSVKFCSSVSGEMRHDELCLDYNGFNPAVILLSCHGNGGNQKWIYKTK